MNFYRAFGLVFASDIVLASLAASRVPPQPADVEIRRGRPARPDPGVPVDDMQVAVNGTALLLSIPDCGWFDVSDGVRITYEARSGITPAHMAAYILGTALGALLHQRALLPLHCNAVIHDDKAFLFCGDSGAGKSTLAACFEARGYTLLTDDLCAIGRDGEGRFSVHPGIPRLKLWIESLEALGREDEPLTRIPWYEDKFEVAMSRPTEQRGYPVAAIYHLRMAGDDVAPGIYRLSGLDAANAVTANIYRRRVADLLGRAPDYLRDSAALIRTIPIFRFNREWGLDRIGLEAAVAEFHIRELVSTKIQS